MRRFEDYIVESEVEHKRETVYILYRPDRQQGEVYLYGGYTNRNRAEGLSDMKGARLFSYEIEGPVKNNTIYVVAFLDEDDKDSERLVEPTVQAFLRFNDAKEFLIDTASDRIRTSKRRPPLEVYALKMNERDANVRIIPL
jgi:hypothetical protein